jgi:small-conductance mechanosensitive channel
LREILSFIFDKITDPLTLPISPLYEWLILAVVGFIAFKIAYRAVGDMYDMGIISSSAGGSLCHWIIRVIVFIPIWAAVYGVIVLAQWVVAHWVLAVCVFAGLLLSGITTYFILKHRSCKEAAV